LTDAAVACSSGRLDRYPPEALAGLAAGLAAAGASPPAAWLDELALHSYAKMSAFTPQARGRARARCGSGSCVWVWGRLVNAPPPRQRVPPLLR
jgi:hypothetical protein